MSKVVNKRPTPIPQQCTGAQTPKQTIDSSFAELCASVACLEESLRDLKLRLKAVLPSNFNFDGVLSCEKLQEVIDESQSPVNIALWGERRRVLNVRDEILRLTENIDFNA